MREFNIRNGLRGMFKVTAVFLAAAALLGLSIFLETRVSALVGVGLWAVLFLGISFVIMGYVEE